MNKSVIIGIVAAIIIIVGGFIIFKPNNKKDSATNTQPSAATNTTPSQSAPKSNNTSTTPSSDQNSSATITYSDSGFSPASLTVKAGTTITIKNNSSESLQFSSDPHPVHTDDPELNASTIEPGQSQTIKVTVTGTHGYHNHLKSSDTGTLIVQ